jgi:hypothetical protein
MFLATYRTIQLGSALPLVIEWQPQNFGHIGSFEIIMLLCIGYILHRGVTIPPLRILVLLGLLHLALSQTRHADVLAMLGPLFLAAPLSLHLYSKTRNARQQVSPSAIAIVLLLLGALTAALAFRKNFEPDPKNTPRAAIARADIAHAGPVLNDYSFGGYLIYAGVAPFIDGRAEIYGRDFTLRHHRALLLQNLPDFLRLLDEYKIGVTLLSPHTPAVALLDRLPDWQRVYSDDIAVVHRRRNEAKPPR